VRLGGSDAVERARAAILLAAIGDARGAPVLEAAVVKTGDARLRLKAIYALGQAGGPSAVLILQGVLGEPGVAAYAYDALRRAAGRGVAGAEAALAGYEGPRPPGPLPPPFW
jgi:HEAT repeat protein